MDLEELKRHADRHRQWRMQLTAENVLECRVSLMRGGYSFWLDGAKIPEEYAAKMINRAFEIAFTNG